MRKQLLFIFNPHSGKGRIKQFLLDIIDIFTKADYAVTVHPTQEPGDCAKEIARLDPRYDLIAVSGGDGTLNEAVTGMLKLPKSKRIPIGYIPAGTMNDFASGNGIPKTMVDAAEAIISGSVINYDIGMFNDSCFIYVAGFGAFTDVSYDTPQLSKNILGNAAYVVEGIKRLPSLTGTHVRIKTEGGEEIEEDVMMCLIMNSASVAGFEVGEFYTIDTSDGLFEIVLIPMAENIIDIASVITSIRKGERDKGGVRVISTKGAEILTDEPVAWTLDGEFGGETTSVRFKVAPSAVQFIIKEN